MKNMEQLSLLEWARKAGPGRTDVEVVADLADELIERLSLEPPIDHRIVASYQGVAQIRVSDLPWSGCLSNENGRLVIQLRASDSPRRRRFTAFHEVGHTFLPGFSIATQYRCDPIVESGLRKDELLSDAAASGLLFPRQTFARDVKALTFGLQSVEFLSNRYDGSLEAAARRFVDFWPEPALLVVLEVRNKPSERGRSDAVPRLRVVYSHARGSWPFIPRHKSAADSSLLVEALEGEVAHGQSSLDGLVSDDAVRADLSAGLFPYLDARGVRRQRVIALYRRRVEVKGKDRGPGGSGG